MASCAGSPPRGSGHVPVVPIDLRRSELGGEFTTCCGAGRSATRRSIVGLARQRHRPHAWGQEQFGRDAAPREVVARPSSARSNEQGFTLVDAPPTCFVALNLRRAMIAGITSFVPRAVWEMTAAPPNRASSTMRWRAR